VELDKSGGERQDRRRHREARNAVCSRRRNDRPRLCQEGEEGAARCSKPAEADLALEAGFLFEVKGSNEGGASSTEYAMLIVFVALAIAVGVPALGTGTANLLISVGSAFASITLPLSSPCRDLVSGRLQLAGDGAERGAKVSADQGERRNGCDRYQRGN
jgi:Flp pilus assembly pilin Flp